MSCNRYHLWAALDVHAFSKAEAVLRFSAEEDGMWVQWQDYANLKAEVERLNAMASECEHLHKGIYSLSLNVLQLKAEVERLRASSFVTAVPVEQYERVIKAGDALYESKIGYYGEQILEDMKHHSGELCRNWNAAKEGKPSV